MPAILFVCTHNLFRSPIAAACLRELLQIPATGEWRVDSAGTWTEDGLSLPAITLQSATALGLKPLEGFRTKKVNPHLLQSFDLTIAMESGQREALQTEFPHLQGRFSLLSELCVGVSYDIPDPATQRVSPFEIAQELRMLIKIGKEKIMHAAIDLTR